MLLRGAVLKEYSHDDWLVSIVSGTKNASKAGIADNEAAYRWDVTNHARPKGKQLYLP